MVGLLIGVAIWMALALIVAVVLGRVARRADNEELGSTLDWNTAEIDDAVHHD
ncbi:hypothetical protein [Rhodococcoides kyotonense]|uniref:Uncharacterized protein n=1 Tax=Rhodococcoides kyotonense TaxID=398843 RepID=A0A239J9D7_9NOCA|nr:hypothetical protein [Rhodococcus kyotonensis]SNT02450.1 hypothetical protein SAMN05421642_108115 [Rhodococcus kyotonensis]